MEDQKHESHTSDEMLQKLKKEILEEIKPEKKQKRISFGNVLVTIVLFLLSVVSALQIIQSVSILNKIKSGAIKPASAFTNAALPTNVQSMPDMVGGC